MSYFLYSLRSGIWGLADWRGLPLPGLARPSPAGKLPFVCKQANPQSYREARSCSWCLCSRRHFPLPDHPGGLSQTTDSPQTPAPAEMIQLVHPNPACSAWPCLSRGNHNEGSRSPFPLASLTSSTDPGASPHGPAGHGVGRLRSLLLGTVSDQRPFRGVHS